MSAVDDRAAQRSYALILRLYPPSFRREFGDDLVLVFSDLVRSGAPHLRQRLALDLLVSLPHLHLEAAMRTTAEPGRVVVLLTILACVAVAVTLGFGLGTLGTVIGGIAALGFIAVAITQRSALGTAFRRPAERGTRAGVVAAVTQAWWAPVAAIHGVLTLGFGVMVGLRGDAGEPGSLMGAAVTFAFGLAVLWGLVLRVERVAVGTAMVLVGSIWLGGAFWMAWPPVVLAVIWIGVITSTLRAPRATVGAA